MAGWTRLELATFCVTGRRSNQLSYHPVKRERGRNVDLGSIVSSVLLDFPDFLRRNDLEAQSEPRLAKNSSAS